MELQFNKTAMPCLQQILKQTQTQEQTQEVRLPENMPDIGSVIACWAQPIIRGKEWHNDAVSVSGGIMAWVLYAPEDAGAEQTVSAWLPFQMKWDIPESRHDGTVLAEPFLRSVDARSLSARKLMVRANIGICAEALVPDEATLYVPDEMPADIRLLKRTYPVRIPVESGEKAFQIEEDLTAPGTMPPPDQVLRYSLYPELAEWKLMADKVVFRGNACVHVLYRGTDGQIYSWEQEIPFSQFADLDREYAPEASAGVIPVVTNLEMEMGEDDTFRMKAGISGQYTIYDRPNIEIVEDVYSPDRTVTPQITEFMLPTVLDEQNQIFHVEQTIEADAAQVLDLAFYPDCPQQIYQGDSVRIQLPGTFQLLYRDGNGAVRSTGAYWEESGQMKIEPDLIVQTNVRPGGKPIGTFSGNGISMQADLQTDTRIRSRNGMPMVTALQIGEEKKKDENRPSLILRKAEENSLWELAKLTGSTVEKIKDANGLTGEPDPNRLLLIPIP